MNLALLLECDNKASLGGSCLRDSINVATALTTRMNFKPENVSFLVSSLPNKETLIKKGFIQVGIASKLALKQTLTALVATSTLKGFPSTVSSTLYVHISGHGYQTSDTNVATIKDELDGYDEYIVLGKNEILLDDDFNLILRQTIPSNWKLRVSLDTCHSGSMCDFAFLDNIRNSRVIPFFRDAFSISACRDDQLDSCDIGNVVGYGGSLTIHMLETPGAMETFLSTQWPWLVSKMLSPILSKLNQTPQFCGDCCHP